MSQFIKLIDLALLQRGYDLPKYELKQGKYPVVYSNGIRNYHSEFKSYGPGVITGRSGTIGKITYVENNYWPHNTTLWVADFKGNHPRYVYYIMQFINFLKYISGSGIPILSRHDIHKEIVFCPSYKEQQAIAEILNIWDMAIKKTERLIYAKERKFGHLVTKLLNKSESPKRQLSDFVTEISERNRDNTMERVLSITKHNRFILHADQFKHRVASANMKNYKIIQHGQYAYNPSRINIGSIARLDDWNNGILSPMYTVFKIDEKNINSDYFLLWLSSKEAKQRIEKGAQSSVRKILRMKELGSILICLPDLSIQQKIAEALNTTKHEINLLKRLKDKYCAQKRGLMQKLLSGKWHINPLKVYNMIK